MKRFQQGNASPAEKNILLQYLEEMPIEEQDRHFQEIADLYWEKEKQMRDASSEAAKEFSALWQKIEDKPLEKTKRSQVWWYYATAAAILLIAFSAIWTNINKPIDTPENAIEWSSKTTVEGQKIKLMLSDSTVIYLAGGSTLRWPKYFVKGQKREVHLEGEAFFEVKRDTTSPFIVHSGQLQTQVLGTSFNIYAYPNDAEQVVSVRTGKVRVAQLQSKSNRTLADLTPGMQLKYDAQKLTFALDEKRDPNSFSAWTVNKLIFHKASLAEIISKLERYYQVKFAIEGHCRNDNLRLNATFENLSLSAIMKQLEFLSGGSIRHKINADKTITLWRKGCR